MFIQLQDPSRKDILFAIVRYFLALFIVLTLLNMQVVNFNLAMALMVGILSSELAGLFGFSFKQLGVRAIVPFSIFTLILGAFFWLIVWLIEMVRPLIKTFF